MKNLAEMADLNLIKRQLALIQAITQESKLYRALWEIGGPPYRIAVLAEKTKLLLVRRTDSRQIGFAELDATGAPQG